MGQIIKLELAHFHIAEFVYNKRQLTVLSIRKKFIHKKNVRIYCPGIRRD